MSSAEWDYWYQGLPARGNLVGTDGRVSVKEGWMRRGGSYQTRLDKIAVWNTVMPNFDYTLQKWHRLLRRSL